MLQSWKNKLQTFVSSISENYYGDISPTEVNMIFKTKIKNKNELETIMRDTFEFSGWISIETLTKQEFETLEEKWFEI